LYLPLSGIQSHSGPSVGLAIFALFSGLLSIICPVLIHIENFFSLNTLYLTTLISIIEVVIVIVPALLTVAFVTVAERKTMASMQSRLGPNNVGYYGLLQAFADALKLLLKKYVSFIKENLVCLFISLVIIIIFSLLGYAVISYGPELAI